MGKNVKVILVLVVLIGIAYLLINNLSSEKISPERVVRLETDYHLNGSEKVVLTKEKNPDQLRLFIDAFNNAKRYRSNVGTTPSMDITMILDNSDKIVVAGNTQGFQIVSRNGKQYYVIGEELRNYFPRNISKP